MKVVNLSRKLSEIDSYWQPRIVAELNRQHLKLVKLRGPFIWHHHENEDELFLVLKGNLTIEFRDSVAQLGPGELIVVPRGVEHRPVADEDVHLLLFEPAGTLNTGNVRNRRTVEHPEPI